MLVAIKKMLVEYEDKKCHEDVAEYVFDRPESEELPWDKETRYPPDLVRLLDKIKNETKKDAKN